MHHEHSGNCCDHVEQHHHEHQHMALPLGQLCCAGACSHPEHQEFTLHSHIEAQLYQHREAEQQEKAKKAVGKRKRRLIGSISVLADQDITRVMQANLAQ